jgi:hypothetical protein
MLYYPKASASPPGSIGATPFVLARPELFFDDALSERWHVAGGMGVIALASTVALARASEGKSVTMPPYDGAPEATHGFAGGIWNTLCARTSYATSPRTHFFVEGSLVMNGVVLADNAGLLPVVVTLGAQHSF